MHEPEVNDDSNKANDTASTAAQTPKFFDIVKPGTAQPSPTTRPLIAANYPAQKDPMVVASKPTMTEPAGAPETSVPELQVPDDMVQQITNDATNDADANDPAEPAPADDDHTQAMVETDASAAVEPADSSDETTADSTDADEASPATEGITEKSVDEPAMPDQFDPRDAIPAPAQPINFDLSAAQAALGETADADTPTRHQASHRSDKAKQAPKSTTTAKPTSESGFHAPVVTAHGRKASLGAFVMWVLAIVLVIAVLVAIVDLSFDSGLLKAPSNISHSHFFQTKP